jgi:hypothetical protein
MNSLKFCNTKKIAIEYLQNSNEEMGIWSFEKKNKNGAMSYIVGQYKDLISMYVNIPENKRFYHEMLLDDKKPIKLFFDLDSTEMNVDKSIISSRIERLHSIVEDLLGLSPHRPVIMDATDSTKYSKHIIYSFAFPNKDILREFIQDLLHLVKKNNDNDLEQVIDMQVYETDHSLRILGSNKRQCDRPFIHESKKFTNIILSNSLIRNVEVNNTIVTKWGDKGCERIGVKKCERIGVKNTYYDISEIPNWDGWSQKDLHNLSNTLLVYLKERYDRKTMYPKWVSNKLLINVRPGLFCPFKKRIHKSNSSCIIITIPEYKTKIVNLYVRVICLDSDCGKTEIDSFSISINTNIES